MQLKDVTPSNVRNFLEGNANYFLGSPEHIKEQAELRASLCSPCLENGKCKKCGCKTPHMFYAPNKVDSAGRWSSMLTEND